MQFTFIWQKNNYSDKYISSYLAHIAQWIAQKLPENPMNVFQPVQNFDFESLRAKARLIKSKVHAEGAQEKVLLAFKFLNH